jgi:aminomethyltransferase
LKQTPLHAEHLALGAKMVPYAGFEMPIQYPGGIQAEHRAVRRAAGLFDVSHMGEFHVSGEGALALLQAVTVNDVSRLVVGQAQYSALCREEGTVLDDLLIYRMGEQEYLVVVNAANRDKDLAWILSHSSSFDAKVVDQSDQTALLALQGPRAQEILAPLVDVNLDGIAYYHIGRGKVQGIPALIARTGYTGEDGFEIYLPWGGEAAQVWKAILSSGAPLGVEPVGLGARDSLRLEMGYPLYGNDLDEEHSALQSGLGWIVRLDKEGGFIGRDALAQEKAAGVSPRLVGIRLQEPGFPRTGYPVTIGGTEVGKVTSGTVIPDLNQGIALAFVSAEHAAPGTALAIRIRNRDVPGVVERPPFHRTGSIRR